MHKRAAAITLLLVLGHSQVMSCCMAGRSCPCRTWLTQDSTLLQACSWLTLAWCFVCMHTNTQQQACVRHALALKQTNRRVTGIICSAAQATGAGAQRVPYSTVG